MGLEFQIWRTDEHRNMAMIDTCDTAKDAIANVKREIHSENLETALADDEVEKNWGYYFPIVVDKNGHMVENILYGGIKTTGDHHFYYLNGNDFSSVGVDDVESNGLFIRMFLGDKDSTPWFAKTEWGDLIETLDSEFLADKVFFAINPVEVLKRNK